MQRTAAIPVTTSTTAVALKTQLLFCINTMLPPHLVDGNGNGDGNGNALFGS